MANNGMAHPAGGYYVAGDGDIGANPSMANGAGQTYPADEFPHLSHDGGFIAGNNFGWGNIPTSTEPDQMSLQQSAPPMDDGQFASGHLPQMMELQGPMQSIRGRLPGPSGYMPAAPQQMFAADGQMMPPYQHADGQYSMQRGIHGGAIHNIFNGVGNTHIHSGQAVYNSPLNSHSPHHNLFSTGNHNNQYNTTPTTTHGDIVYRPANYTHGPPHGLQDVTTMQQGYLASSLQQDDMMATSSNNMSASPATGSAADQTETSVAKKKKVEYARCMTCNKKFGKNVGKATGTQCSRKDCPGSHHNMPKDPETPKLDPVTGGLSQQGVDFYDSFDAAIQGKEVIDPLIKLKLDEDDLPTGTALQHFIRSASIELFNALLEPYAEADDAWTQKVQDKYHNSQKNALKYCEERLVKESERKCASVACTMAVLTVVKVHAEGIPTSAQGPKVSHAPDRKTKFRRRMQLVVKAVSENKIIVKDLLKGEKLEDLAYHPSAWLRRKRSNFVGNTNKNDDQQNGRDAREAAGRDPLVPVKTKKRATSDNDVAGADGEHDAPMAKRGRHQEPALDSSQADMSDMTSSSGPAV